MAHRVVVSLVRKEPAYLADDEVVVGADELDGAGVEGFRALGGAAHHEHRFAETRRLLLDAAGVSEDEGGFLHEVDKLEVLERLDEVEVVVCGEVVAEYLVDRSADVGVEVHRVDEVHVRECFGEVLHRSDHGDEAVAEVFAAMAGDEDEFAAIAEAGDVVARSAQDVVLHGCEGGVALELVDDQVKGVDDGVAGDDDFAVGLLVEEVAPAEGSRAEVVVGNASCDLAVHFLGPGAEEVVGPEARLDVPYGNLLVECSHGRGHRRRGVPVDQHDVRAALFEDVTHAREDACCDVVQVLSLFHDVKVIVRGDVKDPEHLVQHLAVLSRDTDYGLEILGIFLALLYEGAHFDSLGTCPEHQHNFLHTSQK